MRDFFRTTSEKLMRPRGSANFELQKLHANQAPAARVQRFVGLRPWLRAATRRYSIQCGANFVRRNTVQASHEAFVLPRHDS